MSPFQANTGQLLDLLASQLRLSDEGVWTLRLIADGFVPVVMVQVPSVSGERCFSKLSDPLQAGSPKRVSRDADHGCDVFHRMSCCDVTTMIITQIHILIRLTFDALVQCMCCPKLVPSSRVVLLCHGCICESCRGSTARCNGILRYAWTCM
jgi:hypothetical protein